MQTKKNAKAVAAVTTTVPANEETATVETATVGAPKADAKKVEKAPALTEKEKTAIKATKSAAIVAGAAIPANVAINYLKEGFTLYPANEQGGIAVKKALGGIDKLSIKEGAEVQYFFYKNVLPASTLTEIFGENVPATQKFSTGGNNYNPFIRCDVSKIPALISAALSTPYAAALFAAVEEEKTKAAAKEAKKAEKVPEEGNATA